MRISDWSSVVCSSDLQRLRASLAAALFRGLTPACAERKPDKRQAAHRPVAAAQHQGASDEQGIRHPTGERKRAGKAGTAEGAAAAGDPDPRPERRPLLRSRQPGRRSDEHTSELQSLMRISYAVFCLKKKTTTSTTLV